MPVTTSAKRYAQAIFEIALEGNKLKEWQSNLTKVVKLTQDEEFDGLAENPKVPFDLKEKLVEEKLGKTSPMLLNLVYLLISKGKLRMAGQISEEYDRLLNEHYGIKTAEVTTAVQLDSTEAEKLEKQLESLVGKKVTMKLKVNPAILGGFIARIDDSMIDGSIRNRLETLKKRLAETRK
ncbi:MAG TPA: ATP synthase F1 subunit delta [Dehalococcoidia bacterium]|jgi:F-type H+-transporting ATPase subunit delta